MTSRAALSRRVLLVAVEGSGCVGNVPVALGRHRSEHGPNRRGAHCSPVGLATREDALPLDGWEWIPISTLDEAIDFGLRPPHRAFRLYLSGKAPLCGASICFTAGDDIVFGVSVDDPMNEPEVLRQAESVMANLVATTRGKVGWVVCEEPPPLRPDVARPWENCLAMLRA